MNLSDNCLGISVLSILPFELLSIKSTHDDLVY